MAEDASKSFNPDAPSLVNDLRRQHTEVVKSDASITKLVDGHMAKLMQDTKVPVYNIYVFEISASTIIWVNVFLKSLVSYSNAAAIFRLF